MRRCVVGRRAVGRRAVGASLRGGVFIWCCVCGCVVRDEKNIFVCTINIRCVRFLIQVNNFKLIFFSAGGREIACLFCFSKKNIFVCTINMKYMCY